MNCFPFPSLLTISLHSPPSPPPSPSIRSKTFSISHILNRFWIRSCLSQADQQNTPEHSNPIITFTPVFHTNLTSSYIHQFTFTVIGLSKSKDEYFSQTSNHLFLTSIQSLSSHQTLMAIGTQKSHLVGSMDLAQQFTPVYRLQELSRQLYSTLK